MKRPTEECTAVSRVNQKLRGRGYLYFGILERTCQSSGIRMGAREQLAQVVVKLGDSEGRQNKVSKIKIPYGEDIFFLGMNRTFL